MQGDQQTLDASLAVPLAWASDAVEIFIDFQTWVAITKDRWSTGGPMSAWPDEGLDHDLFRDGMIPFKRILVDDQGKPRHDVAAKYYALAHRSGKVAGVPVAPYFVLRMAARKHARN